MIAAVALLASALSYFPLPPSPMEIAAAEIIASEAAAATEGAVRTGNTVQETPTLPPPPPPPTEPAWGVWDRLAQCESGGNWSINTGNGYYGGLQFSLTSWRAVGGTGYPHQHSRSEQINRGEKLKDIQGWNAWPACSRKLGLR